MIIERKANSKIQSMIDTIWYVDEENLEENRRTDILVPTGHLHIVYNLADPYFLIEDNHYKKMPNRLLGGQFKHAIKVKYGRHMKQLGIAVKPAAFYYMFHQYSSLYTSALIDCSELPLMLAMHQEIEKILNNSNLEVNEMLDEVEKIFENFEYTNEDVNLVEQMIKYLDNQEGRFDVKVMARHFGYSVSALERNFNKYMGLTPKAYADIIRFRYAILEDEPERLFYDQSHFIKSCRKYTNKIPRDIEKSEEISTLYMLGVIKE